LAAKSAIAAFNAARDLGNRGTAELKEIDVAF